MSLEKFKKVIHEDFTKDADFIDETIKKLNLNKNSKILDIGTGFGAMAILLAINGFNVLTGEPEVDPERDECEHHENHGGEHHGNHQEQNHRGYEFDWRESAKNVGVEHKIKYQHFDAQDLPFPDNSFDGIFMYDTLQHIKKREVALNESLRVIKTSGIVSVIEWNKKSIEQDEKKYGFTIDYVDPREFLKLDNISIELFKGKFANMYILRKI